MPTERQPPDPQADLQRALDHALDVLGQSPSVLSIQPYDLAAEWYAEVRSALRDLVVALDAVRGDQ